MSDIANRINNFVSKSNKGNEVNAPPQECPKCKKVYHDNKWGGAGKCDCGYYFHPEWYGKTREQTERVDKMRNTQKVCNDPKCGWEKKTTSGTKEDKETNHCPKCGGKLSTKPFSPNF